MGGKSTVTHQPCSPVPLHPATVMCLKDRPDLVSQPCCSILLTSPKFLLSMTHTHLVTVAPADYSNCLVFLFLIHSLVPIILNYWIPCIWMLFSTFLPHSTYSVQNLFPGSLLCLENIICTPQLLFTYFSSTYSLFSERTSLTDLVSILN